MSSLIEFVVAGSPDHPGGILLPSRVHAPPDRRKLTPVIVPLPVELYSAFIRPFNKVNQ